MNRLWQNDSEDEKVHDFDKLEEEIFSQLHDESDNDSNKSDEFIYHSEISDGEGVSDDELHQLLSQYCNSNDRPCYGGQDIGKFKLQEDLTPAELPYWLDDKDAQEIVDETDDSESYTSLDDDKLYAKFLKEHAEFQSAPKHSNSTSSPFDFGVQRKGAKSNCGTNCVSENIIARAANIQDGRSSNPASWLDLMECDTSSMTLPTMSPCSSNTDDPSPMRNIRSSICFESCPAVCPTRRSKSATVTSEQRFDDKPRQSSHLDAGKEEQSLSLQHQLYMKERKSQSKASPRQNPRLQNVEKALTSNRSNSEESQHCSSSTASNNAATVDSKSYNLPKDLSTSLIHGHDADIKFLDTRDQLSQYFSAVYHEDRKMSSHFEPIIDERSRMKERFDKGNVRAAQGRHSNQHNQDHYNGLAAKEKQKRNPKKPNNVHSPSSDNTAPPSSITLNMSTPDPFISAIEDNGKDKRTQNIESAKNEYRSQQSSQRTDENMSDCQDEWITIGVLETAIDDGMTKIIPVTINLQKNGRTDIATTMSYHIPPHQLNTSPALQSKRSSSGEDVESNHCNSQKVSGTSQELIRVDETFVAKNVVKSETDEVSYDKSSMTLRTSLTSVTSLSEQIDDINAHNYGRIRVDLSQVSRQTRTSLNTDEIEKLAWITDDKTSEQFCLSSTGSSRVTDLSSDIDSKEASVPEISLNPSTSIWTSGDNQRFVPCNPYLTSSTTEGRQSSLSRTSSKDTDVKASNVSKRKRLKKTKPKATDSMPPKQSSSETNNEETKAAYDVAIFFQDSTESNDQSSPLSRKQSDSLPSSLSIITTDSTPKSKEAISKASSESTDKSLNKAISKASSESTDKTLNKDMSTASSESTGKSSKKIKSKASSESTEESLKNAISKASSESTDKSSKKIKSKASSESTDKSSKKMKSKALCESTDKSSSGSESTSMENSSQSSSISNASSSSANLELTATSATISLPVKHSDSVSSENGCLLGNDKAFASVLLELKSNSESSHSMSQSELPAEPAVSGKLKAIANLLLNFIESSNSLDSEPSHLIPQCSPTSSNLSTHSQGLEPSKESQDLQHPAFLSPKRVPTPFPCPGKHPVIKSTPSNEKQSSSQKLCSPNVNSPGVPHTPTIVSSDMAHNSQFTRSTAIKGSSQAATPSEGQNHQTQSFTKESVNSGVRLPVSQLDNAGPSSTSAYTNTSNKAKAAKKKPDKPSLDDLNDIDNHTTAIDPVYDSALGNTHNSHADVIDKILNVDAEVNLNKKTTSLMSTIQRVDGSVLDPNLELAQVSYTQPMTPGKDTFYWVPQDFKDYLHISDHPLSSDYFPRFSNTKFCCVMIREFVHVHFYLKLHPDSQPCYAKYNILIWDKNKSPVAHFRSQCPVRMLSGSAHHVSTLSEVSMLELLSQETIVVSCQVTNFSKWEPGMKDREAPWFLTNGPLRSKGQHDVDALFNNDRYADVTLVSSDGQKYPAHRAIICSESTLLQQQIDSVDESTISVNLRGPILKQILYTFYTGELPPYSQAGSLLSSLNDRWREILEILVAAVRIEAPRLQRKCEAWLATSLDKSNACSIYAIATRLQLESLALACREFIKIHRKDVVGSRDWLTLKTSPMALADLLLNTDIYAEKPKPSAFELCSQPDFYDLNSDAYYPTTARYTASPDDILKEYGYNTMVF